MAASRTKTTIAFGLLGLFAAGAATAAWNVTTPFPAPQRQSSKEVVLAQTTPALPSQPAPFVATALNETDWRPETLPIDWPSFTKVPDEKPLPTKSTKLKIDGAKAIIEKWNAYLNLSNKTMSFPTQKDAGIAIRYLLTIPRNDPAFPEAWATFIKLRHVDKDIASESTRLADVAERKRIAKTRGVTVGMTQEEVLGSNWGKPTSINTTITAYGRREQWVYRGSNYLYFERGRLISIQTDH